MMRWDVVRMEDMSDVFTSLVQNRKGIDHLNDLGIDGTILIKQVLKKVKQA
jgi:hypothetical protein